MTFDDVQVGIILRSKPREVSYLIYEKGENYIKLFDVTSKKKYRAWDKINPLEWADRLWSTLDVSKNRFDMHNSIATVFELIPKTGGIEWKK